MELLFAKVCGGLSPYSSLSFTFPLSTCQACRHCSRRRISETRVAPRVLAYDGELSRWQPGRASSAPVCRSPRRPSVAPYCRQEAERIRCDRSSVAERSEQAVERWIGVVAKLRCSNRWPATSENQRLVEPSRIASSGVIRGRATSGSETLAPELDTVRCAWRTVVSPVICETAAPFRSDSERMRRAYGSWRLSPHRARMRRGSDSGPVRSGTL